MAPSDGQATATPADGGQVDPGQGGGGEQAPAQQPTQEPAQPAPQQQPAPPQQQSQSLSDLVQDAQLKEWVEAKGFQDVDTALKSHRNLEKFVGAPADEILRLPKDAGPDQQREVLQRLGLPGEPGGYEIPIPDNLPHDEGFVNWSKEAFHKAGLTKSQAESLANEWNEFVGGMATEQDQNYEAKVEAEDQTLRREWGNGYDRQINVAKSAAQQLGFDENVLNAMEQNMGFDGTMKFLANLGQKLGEDNFVDGEAREKGFHSRMTPAEAKQAWAAMTSDPEKMKALNDKNHAAHKEMLARKSELFQVMHPEA